MSPSGLSCALYPQPPLLPWMTDTTFSIILPTIIYILSSGFFHFLDSYNFLESYRIHPSEEVLKRNHVTRWQCLKQVVGYHVLQIAIGMVWSRGGGPTMIGDEACQIHIWAERMSRLTSIIPTMLLKALGIDTAGLIKAVAGATSKGLMPNRTGDFYYYPTLWSLGKSPEITHLDVLLAKATFYIGIPALQYLIALAIVDTWIYFTHRLCHTNKTLYRIVHAQHHRLYVSYAYGAVYAHPLESLFLDILSFILANSLARLSERQSMLFGSLAVIKTISDHCGYVFPWDPFLAVNSNGARFHDLHHQTWGLKSNFSTYTTFWDWLCGTIWVDEDAARMRYVRVWGRDGGDGGDDGKEEGGGDGRVKSD